ncbi:MAG: sugar transferase [Bacteroidales bacterium]|nr:sugar transferase [Bacteroidales bacterium]MDD4671321.1 sugar transferase [Bacteroidales bacterium]MDY0348398.1 sugar transferase [Tenuifilaceae bacterium]
MFSRFFLLLLDLLLFFLGFCLSISFKPSGLSYYIDNYSVPLLVFVFAWVLPSIVSGKYVLKGSSFAPFAKRILLSNFITLAIVTSIMFFLYSYTFSRIVVLGTVGFATLLELITYGMWFFVKQSYEIKEMPVSSRKPKRPRRVPQQITEEESVDFARRRVIRQNIVRELGLDVYAYLSEAINLNVASTLIVSTITRFNIDSQPTGVYNTIVNIKRVNDIRWINKFFESVNQKLSAGGVYVCMAETKELRKQRILHKFPPVLNFIYYGFDFIIKRVLPKFKLTKKLYFILTRGENRVLSRAELLGRLYSCGFEVHNEEYIGGYLYVVCQKIKEPAYDLEPTYGPIIKLRRIGKGGKEIKIYKMRTMHPYAEYLQEYVYQQHDLKDGGKFKHDFRVTTLGRIMRRLWIDELPSIINLIKGELKIVGVRPLSHQYFGLYTKELQEKRVKYRPGLVPPFYVDNPKTLDEIMASEHQYLDAHAKNPLLTDMRYFFKAFYNIIFKKYRSS